MKRKPLLLGNWKMNTTPEEGRLLVRQMAPMIQDAVHIPLDWGLAVPYPHLGLLAAEMQGTAWLGAQDCSAHAQGAYSGEVSAGMLAGTGCAFSLVGHSERRSYHGETSEACGLKITQLKNHGLVAVYCVGETLEERQEGRYARVITDQLSLALEDRIGGLEVDDLVVAYEPVWAIGTGLTATPSQANEVHTLIRDWFRHKAGASWSDALRILYGGSVTDQNAAELLQEPEVDGALVGGASLKPRMFADIVLAARS